MTLNYEPAVERLRSAPRLILISHTSPDPDAIGSTLGLGLALRAAGHETTLINGDAIPQSLQFLPGAETLITGAAALEVPHPDLVIALDASDADRLGPAGKRFIEAGVPLLVIDHHITNTAFGQINLVDPDAASTAEMIVPLLDALGIAINRQAADCLLAGIIADTQSFATTAVRGDTLRAAARLLDAGGDIARLTDVLLRRVSFQGMGLWGIGLSHMHAENGLIWASIPYAERAARGIAADLNAELSNQLRYIEGALLVAVFTENSQGGVKLSMRAQPGFDVAELALALGGGGHTLAAGADLPGPLDDAIARTLPALKDLLRKGAGA